MAVSKTFGSTDIASLVIKGLLDKTKVLEKAKVDGVVCGSAQGDIKAFNPARYAALGAGLPIETECHYIEMQCGSAITSINHAAAQIALGFADIMVARWYGVSLHLRHLFQHHGYPL